MVIDGRPVARRRGRPSRSVPEAPTLARGLPVGRSDVGDVRQVEQQHVGVRARAELDGADVGM